MEAEVMCRCTLAAPFSSSSRFSSLYSFASGLPGHKYDEVNRIELIFELIGEFGPGATAGPPPCIFCERMEQTSTMQFGMRPEARHLMSKNFSAPMSDPKPASVHTKPCPERHLADAVLRHFSRILLPFFRKFAPVFSVLVQEAGKRERTAEKRQNVGEKRPRKSGGKLRWVTSSPTSFRAILSAMIEEFPCAMLAKGPAWIRTGVPSIVCIRVGMIASIIRTVSAPPHPAVQKEES